MPAAPVQATRLLGLYIGGGVDLALGTVSVGFNITGRKAASASDAALGQVTLDIRGWNIEGTIITENLNALTQLATAAAPGIGATVSIVIKYQALVAGVVTPKKWTFDNVRFQNLGGLKFPHTGSDEPTGRATVKFTAVWAAADTTISNTLICEAWPP